MTEKEVSQIIDVKLPADLESARIKLLAFVGESKKSRSVLGVDVYRYNQMPELGQVVLPHCIHNLIEGSIADLQTHERALFSEDILSEARANLIDTGDGFFITFPDPIRAFCFAVYFHANLSTINSGNQLQFIRFVIPQGISVRYALTLGEVYHYENKIYGKPIIACARLLSMDKLNRFLLDTRSIKWFDLWTNGIETLARISHTCN